MRYNRNSKWDESSLYCFLFRFPLFTNTHTHTDSANKITMKTLTVETSDQYREGGREEERERLVSTILVLPC